MISQITSSMRLPYCPPPTDAAYSHSFQRQRNKQSQLILQIKARKYNFSHQCLKIFCSFYGASLPLYPLLSPLTCLAHFYSILAKHSQKKPLSAI